MDDTSFRIAFYLGEFPVYWYALLFAVGIIAAVVVADVLTRRDKLGKDIALDLCIIGIPAGLVGARLFAVIAGLVPIANFFKFNTAGLALWGALIFGAIGAFIYCKIKKYSFGKVMDCVVPAALIGIAIGRWGDFFNRDALGPIVTNRAFQWFPLAAYGTGEQIHYACFFYEFIFIAAIVAVLLLLKKRGTMKAGAIGAWGLLLYAIESSAVELIREDRAMVGGAIKFNVLIGIIVALVAVYLLLKVKNSAPKADHIFDDEDVAAGEGDEAKPEAQAEDKEDEGDKPEAEPELEGEASKEEPPEPEAEPELEGEAPKEELPEPEAEPELEGEAPKEELPEPEAEPELEGEASKEELPEPKKESVSRKKNKKNKNARADKKASSAADSKGKDDDDDYTYGW